MTTPVNKEWICKGIDGEPTPDNFEVREVPYPTIEDGEYIIKTDYFSVDPYLRGQFANPATLNKAVDLYSVGTVIESKNDTIKVGDVVTGILPAQLYIKQNDTTIRKVDQSLGMPLSYYVGILGMPGATAYHMIDSRSEQIKDKVVFITASTGAVGTLGGWLARQRGAKLVIGTAGSDEKCKLAVEKYGYHVCLNYKKYFSIENHDDRIAAFQADLKEVFAKYDVTGIDVFYDLVGGFISDSVWSLFNLHGFAVIIGAIDQYNEKKPYGPRFLIDLVYKFVNIYTELVFGYFGPQFPEFTKEFETGTIPAIKDAKLPVDETILDGIDNMTDAFIGLFSGANTGKMVVKP